MPRVFAANVPLRLSKEDRSTWVALFSLQPAEQYGKLVTIFKQSEIPANTEEMIDQIWERMEYKPDDFILPIGDPLVSHALTAVAARQNGGTYTTLRWSRVLGCYEVKTIKAWEEN